MKTIEKAALVAGGTVAAYFLAKTAMNIAASNRGTQQAQEAARRTALSLANISSEVYYAVIVGDTTKTGIGRQLVPHFVAFEEWDSAGRPVRDEPGDKYDVYVESTYTRGEGGKWVVTDVHSDDPNSKHFDLEMTPYDPRNRQESYIALAESVEKRLGRTGLTIVVA